jgi:tetratricopeptide (TPR) repeat protein
MIALQPTETLLEKIMRFSPAAIALSLSFAMLSSASIGKKADDEINPLSISLMEQGQQATKDKAIEEAISLYETALAVDPRNRAAYLEMARAVRSKGLNGKAIRFYKEALELEPNDQVALAEQTETMIAKGAVEQAKANLARLKLLCKSNCGNVDKLALSIQKAGEKPVLQASAVEIKPVAGEMPTKAN